MYIKKTHVRYIASTFVSVSLSKPNATIMSSPLVGPVDVQEQWSSWKAQHSKSYDSEEEEQKRFKIFEQNLQDILDHNEKFQAGEESYSKALNRMADLTTDELPRGGLMAKR